MSHDESSAPVVGQMRRRRALMRLVGVVAGAAGATWQTSPAWAHGFKAGGVRIDHPYATPTLQGTQTGAVYFRGLSNQGKTADRLLQAQSSVAGTVEIHRMTLDGGVMRMRAVDAIDLPAGDSVPTRHDQSNGYHLMLHHLKAPLKEGDRFTLRLRFEQAGWQDVVVWVQNPRKPAAHTH